MRILEIIDVDWWNACAYYAVELSRGLRAAGDQVVVAGGPDSLPIERARAAALEVWTSPLFDARRAPRALLGLGRYARELGRRRFDVIDAHRAPGHARSALVAACRGGPPVVRTRGDIRPPKPHRVNRWLHRRWTAAHVVPSRFMRQQLVERFGIAGERVHLIPAGIDLERHALAAPARQAGRALRARLGVPEEAVLLAVVARLSPVKGQALSIEALGRLAGVPAPHLCLAGQQEEVRAADLLARAAALGVGEQVHWIGRQDDVRPVLAAADLLLIPSLGSEAICRILLEAMAAGVPALASRVGVIGEVIADGDSGRLVPPGDAGALAAALGELTAPWPAARARLAAMGAAARRRAETEYGLATWVRRTRAVYRQVCRPGAAR